MSALAVNAKGNRISFLSNAFGRMELFCRMCRVPKDKKLRSENAFAALLLQEAFVLASGSILPAPEYGPSVVRIKNYGAVALFCFLRFHRQFYARYLFLM
jgi:hypothetical protein